MFFVFFVVVPLGAQTFRSDDPVRVDPDNLPIAKPKRTRFNDYYDFVENTFFSRGDKVVRRAMNISTLGEVPDSSWYANRMSNGPWIREDLLRGPGSGPGPAQGPWTVVAGKSQGISPGFTIRDSRGDTYFLKFDPVSNPEMATAAEVICSRLFHALGYNVPEYYLVTLRPGELQIAPTARIRNELDEGIPLTHAFIDSLLSTVAHNADGSVRAIASKLLPGERVGPFKFYGTRADDANDVIPHEHRRELRGYYVFCAWLNHDDSRSVNTLDMYVSEGGRGYVKHHLIDFGSTLGSASIFAQKRRAGNEYLWEAGPTFAGMASMGIWLRPWVMVRYPDFPSIGRFEADFFRPEKWKPEYPNPAFQRMDAEDAFWAARQVMRFTNEDLRAVAGTGKLSNSQAEAYLIECLIRRRDKIGNYWLRQASSLDQFRVEDGVLRFSDLLVTYGLESRMPEQQARFAAFNNQTASRTELATPVSLREGRLELPEAIRSAAAGFFFVVSLSSGPHAVELFLKKSGGQLQIVGIHRN